MANNLFVSYDLMSPGQDYAKIEEAIKQMGNWAKLQFSFFYVNSALSAQQAAAHVWQSMDSNDKLIVIDATNNHFHSYNLAQEVIDQLQKEWNR